MVSYNSILCDTFGDEVHGTFFGKPNSSSHGVREAEQPPVTGGAFSSARVFNEATVDLMVSVAIEDQPTNRHYIGEM